MPTVRKSLLEYATSYLKQGYSIIPLHFKEKTPNAKLLPNGWSEYQHRQPCIGEVKNWFSNNNHNIAIITGKISNIVVVDCDSDEAIKWAKANIDTNTLTAKTAKGLHFYYQYPTNGEVRNSVKVNGIKLDIRGEGGYVVAPPSIHPSGTQYQWLNDATLKPFPSILLEQNQASAPTTGVTPEMLLGTSKGDRNNTLAKISGLCFGKGLSFDETLQFCLTQNRMNQPPLPESEVVRTVKSIYTREIRKKAEAVQIKHNNFRGREPTITEEAIKIIKSNIKTIFEDEYSNFYAVLNDNRYYPLKSTKFRRLAQKMVIKELNRAVSEDTIKTAISNIEALAEDEVEKKELSVRTTVVDNKLLYHLGGFKGVKIANENWQIIDIPPVFRIFEHQHKQPTPELNATIDDIWRIFELVNIRNDEHQILFLTYLLYSFIPNVSYPFLIFFGEQGSGKSSAQKVLKELIDPSTTTLLSLKSIDDLRVFAYHHHLLAYDNLTYVSQDLSDEFCKISTGGGSAKRKLYSDNELTYFNYKRPQCASGINLIAKSPDLLDRSIIIKLDRWAISQKLTDTEFDNKLRELKPLLLGSIFTILAQVWGNTHKIPYPLERIESYSFYGYFFAETLGYGGVKFLEAFKKNKHHSSEELIENTPLGNIIITHFNDRTSFSGTPKQLYEELKATAERLNVLNEFPKAVNVFMRKLNILESTLREFGIVITEQHNGLQRILNIEKFNPDYTPLQETEGVPDFDKIPF